VRAWFLSLIGLFMTPAGLVVLGALDSSLVFFLPLGIDVVLVLMTARNPEWFWAYGLAATAGSLIGASVTYWLGRKAGKDGLGRWLGTSRLQRVQRRISDKAPLGVAVLGLIPPPFPFTALVLAAGAIRLDAWRFFGALAVVRAARFGAESALAARYGEQLLTWMESTTFEIVVGVLIVLSLGGTAVSGYKAFRPAGPIRTGSVTPAARSW
jgi:membrane protein YqaA with SNARE-associated domain